MTIQKVFGLIEIIFGLYYFIINIYEDDFIDYFNIYDHIKIINK